MGLMLCPMQKMQAGFIAKARAVQLAEETGKRVKAGSLNHRHLIPNCNYGFNWNSALAQDPFDKKNNLFSVASFYTKATGKGVSWETIFT